ncbi:MAG: hypothetical protein AB7F43_01985 [Bacteriovoracia bacterium]
MRHRLKWLALIFFGVVVWFFAFPNDVLAKNVRTIEVTDGQVANINLALGYSTIIEFPTKPSSAVLGDQDAFKLEYVGKGITIKPLIPNVKSNLFVFTEYDRFNCTLRTVSPSEVDYIVRVKNKRSEPSQLKGKREKPPRLIHINRAATHEGIKLKVRSIKKFSNGFDEVLFEISSKDKDYDFSARSLGLKSGSEYLVIENLYLESASLVPKKTILGKLIFRSMQSPVSLIFAVPSTTKKEKVYRLAVLLKPQTKEVKLDETKK